MEDDAAEPLALVSDTCRRFTGQSPPPLPSPPPLTVCLCAADSCLFHPGVPVFHDALKVSLCHRDLKCTLTLLLFCLFLGLVLLSEENDRFLRVPVHQGEKAVVL